MAQEKIDEWQEVKGGEIFEFAKEGDYLEGKLIDVRSEIGENKSMMYDIEDSQGKLHTVWGCTVLDGKMKRVGIGEQVRVVFLGWKKSDKKGSREYKDFQVLKKQ